MEAGPTPRQVAKGLLNGILPPRPLFLPLVFALGAKVENLPLDAYRKNPTKIVSALWQMRVPSGSDGVLCSFDRFLESEALGGPGTPIESMPAAGELPQKGRVPVSVEVIRRLNATPNRDFLLAAGVTGPLTLAAQIVGVGSEKPWRYEEIPETSKNLAGSVATQAATAFLEAGADFIFLHEPALPTLSSESAAEWANLLAPTINAIRFFEALPALLLTDPSSTIANWELIVRNVQDAVICVPVEATVSRQSDGKLATAPSALGIALPVGMFGAAGARCDSAAVRSLFDEALPAVFTTDAEVTDAADLKNLAQFARQQSRGK